MVERVREYCQIKSDSRQMDPSTKTLNGIQILILILSAIVLILGINWGLPSETRINVIKFGMNPSDRRLTELESSTKRYFKEMNRRDEQNLQAMEKGQVLKMQIRKPPGAFFTDEERFLVFRRYVVSSSAFDERTPYETLG
jgi:hypothetical protein